VRMKQLLSNGPTLSGKSTKTSQLLPLIALLLLMALSACSSKASVIQTLPAPPANLAAPCKNLTDPPNPLIDPERALWEKGVIEAFGDCKLKHRLVVEAWQEALKANPK